MIIKDVSAKNILDSRNEKTISVRIKTSSGEFNASAPTGKSTGKYEASPYKKNLEEDIKTLKKMEDYFLNISINNFNDLYKIEEISKSHLGANTTIALEYAALKALAYEQKKEVWQIISQKANKIPVFAGNCVGGGLHSNNKKPDFQEFLLMGNNAGTLKKAQNSVELLLKKMDKDFSSKYNDEHAWQTALNEKEVLEILTKIKKWHDVQIGIDIAASSFFSRGKYNYKNPLLKRNPEEQFQYVKSLIKNFSLFYIEDPFEENSFELFTKLLKVCPETLIVGDDLTTTNPIRLQRAIDAQSINAIIVKPNQIGSLLKVKEVCAMAKENNIKIIFSHRSGETTEDILADLAVGFEADFIKCGISGKGREEKIKRIEEIKKTLRITPA